MKRWAKAVTIGLLIPVAACGEQGPDTIEVTNISDRPIYMSSDPDSLYADLVVGRLEAGQTATASCVVGSEEFAESLSVLVDDGEEQGYIATNNPGVVTFSGEVLDDERAQLVRPGPIALLATLEQC